MVDRILVKKKFDVKVIIIMYVVNFVLLSICFVELKYIVLIL